MLSWISNNKEWLFSVIGVSLFCIIVGLIIRLNEIKERKRFHAVVSFLRLEIMNNYRILVDYNPQLEPLPILEDNVWEKVNTEIVDKLPFVLTNHLIVHYYFIRNSSKLLPTITAEELERQKNRMRFLIKRLRDGGVK